jgi:hypothetical protein
MKAYVAIAVLLLNTLFAKAQMTLDHTFTSGGNMITQFVDLAVDGKKYSVYDAASNQIKLYNLDYSLWKSIPLPTYSGYKLFSMV